MAAGANDANGVYLYGEDDTIGLLSTFLNKLGTSVSGAITTIKSRLSALEIRTAPRIRAWTFERTSSNAFDSFGSGSFVGLISGTITAAPAGDYLVTVTAGLSADAQRIGNARLLAAGQPLTEDIRHDLDGMVRVFNYTGTLENFAGGDLTVQFLYQPSAGTGTLQTNGAAIRVAYLGPRA